MELPEAGKPLRCGDWMLMRFTSLDQYDLRSGEDGRAVLVASFFDPDLALAVWMMIQAAHRPEAKE